MGAQLALLGAQLGQAAIGAGIGMFNDWRQIQQQEKLS